MPTAFLLRGARHARVEMRRFLVPRCAAFLFRGAPLSLYDIMYLRTSAIRWKLNILISRLLFSKPGAIQHIRQQLHLTGIQSGIIHHYKMSSPTDCSFSLRYHLFFSQTFLLLRYQFFVSQTLFALQYQLFFSQTLFPLRYQLFVHQTLFLLRYQLFVHQTFFSPKSSSLP